MNGKSAGMVVTFFIIFLFIGFSQGIIVKKELFRCVNGNCSTTPMESLWVEEGDDVLVRVSVINNFSYPVSGFVWDTYPKDLMLYNDSFNFSEPMYYAVVTEYPKLTQLTGSLYKYIPVRLVGKVNIPKMLPYLDPNITGEYNYIVVGFNRAGNYKFIDIPPNSSFVFEYMLHVNKTGLFRLGRAAFTTRLYGVVFNPKVYFGHFCELSGGVVEQPLLISAVGMNLTNVSIMIDPVTDIYGNEVSGIFIDTDVSFIDKIYEGVSRLIHLKINVSYNVSIGEYISRLYISSDEIYQSQPMYIRIYVHQLQNNNPDGYCYVKPDYEPPYAKVIPKDIVFAGYVGNSLVKEIIIENGGGSKGNFSYSFTCKNGSLDVISPISGSVELSPGETYSFTITSTVSQNCSGYLNISVKDMFNTTVQTYSSNVVQVVLPEDSRAGFELVNCSTYNPIPSELNLDATATLYELSLCVHNTGISETEVVTLNNFVILTSPDVLKDVVFYDSEGNRVNDLVLSPGGYGKIVLYLDLSNKPNLLNISVYSLGASDSVVYNITYTQPQILVSPSSLALGCVGNITITNTGSLPTKLDISFNGDLANYLDIRFHNLKKTKKLEISEISLNDWLVSYPGRNIINYREDSSQGFLRGYYISPGESIIMEVGIDYLDYLYTSSDATSGTITIYYDNGSVSIPVTYNGSECLPSRDSTVYANYVGGEYLSNGDTLVSWKVHAFKEFLEKSYVNKVYLYRYYSGNVVPSDLYINGNYYGNVLAGDEINYVGICMTKGTIEDCYRVAPPNQCGNGVIEINEECDYMRYPNGCPTSAPTCTSDCTCGDVCVVNGVLDPGEVCDPLLPSSVLSGYTCDNKCRLVPSGCTYILNLTSTDENSTYTLLSGQTVLHLVAKDSVITIKKGTNTQTISGDLYLNFSGVTSLKYSGNIRLNSIAENLSITTSDVDEYCQYYYINSFGDNTITLSSNNLEMNITSGNLTIVGNTTVSLRGSNISIEINGPIEAEVSGALSLHSTGIGEVNITYICNGSTDKSSYSGNYIYNTSVNNTFYSYSSHGFLNGTTSNLVTNGSTSTMIFDGALLMESSSTEIYQTRVTNNITLLYCCEIERVFTNVNKSVVNITGTYDFYVIANNTKITIQNETDSLSVYGDVVISSSSYQSCDVVVDPGDLKIVTHNSSVTYNNYTAENGTYVIERTICSDNITLMLRNGTVSCSHGDVSVLITTNNSVYELKGNVSISVESNTIMRLIGTVNVSVTSVFQENVREVCGGKEVSNVSYGEVILEFDSTTTVNDTYEIENYSVSGLEISFQDFLNGSYEYILGNASSDFFVNYTRFYFKDCFKTRVFIPPSCPLIQVTPEGASFEVPLGGTASQTFTITNTGNRETSTLRLNISGDDLLLTVSQLSKSVIPSIAPGDSDSFTLYINVPYNETYIGEYSGTIDIHEETCGTVSIPFNVKIGNSSLIVIPYDVTTNESLENMTVQISSLHKRTLLPINDTTLINYIRNKFKEKVRDIILKQKGIYIINNVDPGTHTIEVVDPNLRYLSNRQPVIVESGEDQVVLVPMTPGEILSLKVFVSGCTSDEINSGTCTLARGENYTVVINTTIQELRYYIRYGFEVDAHQYVKENVVTYKLVFRCVRDSCVIPPDIDNGIWLIPSENGLIVGDGGVPPCVGCSGWGGGGGGFGGGGWVSFTVVNPAQNEVDYIDIHIKELYKVVWYEVEENFTVTSTASSNIPGEHATIIAKLKNNDPYKSITDVCVTITSDVGINVSGFNCTGTFCMDDAATKCIDLLRPNETAEFSWDIQAGYYMPLGVHNITVYAVGEYTGTNTQIYKEATVGITIVRPEVLTLSAVSGLPPGSKASVGELVPMTISVSNVGSRAATNIHLFTDYVYNLAFDSPCEADISYLGPGDRVNVVCYGRVLTPGDAVVIFKATSRYSETITRLIIPGEETVVDLKLIPSEMTFRKMHPGDVLIYPVKMLNPGNIAMDVQYRVIKGDECTYLLRRYTGNFSLSCTQVNPAEWINFTPNEFTLEPGQLIDLNMTISIPELDELLSTGECTLEKINSPEGCWYYGIFEFFGRSHDTVTRVIGALSISVDEHDRYVVKMKSMSIEDVSKNKKTLYLSTEFGCNYSNKSTGCYMKPDIGISTPVALTTIYDGNIQIVPVNDGIHANGTLILRELYGGHVNVTLTTDSDWISVTPSFVTLEPHEVEVIHFNVTVPAGTAPGSYVKRVSAWVNDSIVSGVTLVLKVPEKLYYSPKVQYVGAHRIGELVPFNITIRNGYPEDIVLSLTSDDKVIFDTSQVIIRSGSTYVLTGHLRVPQKKYWTCGKVRPNIKIGTRDLTTYVEYCVVGIYGKLGFSPDLSVLSKLAVVPQGDTEEINVYVKTFNVNTTGIATIYVRPGGTNPVDINWFENDTRTVTVNPGQIANVSFRFIVPENAPSGTYFVVISGSVYLPQETQYYQHMGLNTLRLTIFVPTKINASPSSIAITISEGDLRSLINKIVVKNYDITGDMEDVVVAAYGTGPNPLNASWLSFAYPTVISKYTDDQPGIGYVSIYFDIPDLTPPGLYEGIIRVSGFVNGVYQYVDIPIKIRVVNKMVIICNPNVYMSINDGSSGTSYVNVFNRAHNTDLTGVEIDPDVEWETPGAINNITLSSPTISISPRTSKKLTITADVAYGTPAGSYVGTLYVIDDVGRRVPVSLNIFVPERLKINGEYPNNKGVISTPVVVSLFNGESMILNVSVEVEDIVSGVRCINGQPGTYISVGLYAGTVSRFVNIPYEYTAGVCKNPGVYTFRFNISIPYTEMPGDYKDYIMFKTSTGRIVYLPIEIKVLPSYSISVSPSEVTAPHGKATSFDIIITNNRDDTLSGNFTITGLHAEWMNLTYKEFTIPAHGSITVPVSVNVPYLQKAAHYTFAVNGNAGQRFVKYFIVTVPVDINVSYDSNITDFVVYDLIPKTFVITISNRNLPGNQVHLLVDEYAPYVQFTCGSQTSYGDIVVSFTDYNQTIDCLLSFMYPDAYPEGTYLKHLYIEDGSETLSLDIPLNITVESSIDIYPVRVFSEAIPETPTSYTLTIRNNAPYEMLLIPKVIPVTSSPVNSSWFSVDSVTVPANSSLVYYVNYTLPEGYFGAYYGKIRFTSDWGHVRYSNLIIKSAVDMILDVC